MHGKYGEVGGGEEEFRVVTASFRIHHIKTYPLIYLEIHAFNYFS